LNESDGRGPYCAPVLNARAHTVAAVVQWAVEAWLFVPCPQRLDRGHLDTGHRRDRPGPGPEWRRPGRSGPVGIAVARREELSAVRSFNLLPQIDHGWVVALTSEASWKRGCCGVGYDDVVALSHHYAHLCHGSTIAAPWPSPRCAVAGRRRELCVRARRGLVLATGCPTGRGPARRVSSPGRVATNG